MDPNNQTPLTNFSLKHLAAATGLAGAVALWFSMKSDRPREELRDTYTDENSNFTTIRGMDVHYRDTGSGVPLVLLHGTASSLHTWEPWAERLSDSFRVIRMDLPGFGLTGADPSARYHLTDYVDFLEAFRQTLGLESFHLAGNSFGGKVSYTYTLDRPESVRKIILIDSMGFMKRWPSLLYVPTIPLIGRAVQSISPRWLITQFVRNLYGRTDRLSNERLKRYYELFLADGNREALHQRLNTEIVRNHEKLGKIKVPTLVQWGTNDPLLPVNQANYFGNKLRKSSVVTYLGAGHMPMEELPDRTASDAGRFLSK